MKKNSSRQKRCIISIVVFIGLFLGCHSNKNSYPYKIKLIEQNASSDTIKTFEVNYHSKDSILVNRLILIKDSMYTSCYLNLLKKENGFYGLVGYHISEDSGVKTIIDTIKVFGFTDTSFIYTPPGDAIVPFEGYGWKYIIKKVNENQFLTTQILLSDTLFRRTYYYNNDYQVSKIIIETWKGSTTYE